MNTSASRFDGLCGNGGKSLHCIHCGSAVTSSDRILEIAGRFRHVFVNPAGMRCELLTLLSCPGASLVGEATLDHTWFEGYRWRLALCQNCGMHLGWHYEALSNTIPLDFWGLLLAHLTVRP